jgi:hypothetical protein
VSLKFVDSWDHYQTIDIGKKWTIGESGHVIGSDPAIARHASYLQLEHYAAVSTPDFGEAATVIVGFAYKFTNTGVFLSDRPMLHFLSDGGTEEECYLRRGIGAYLDKLELWRVGDEEPLARSTSVLVCDTWYYIEIKLKVAVAGSFEVRVDGDVWLSDADADTHAVNSYCDVIMLVADETYHGAFVWDPVYFDDLYICDATGGKNNDFLGPVHVVALYPNGVGAHTDWTPLAGANYQCVDESSDDYPDADTYVSSLSAADIDTYGFDSVPYPPGGENTVAGVQVNLWCRQTIPDGRTIAPVIRSSELDYEGTAVPLTVGYLDEHEAFDNEPNTDTDWTITNVNAAQFGMKLVT